MKASSRTVATIIAQLASAVWVLKFLTGKKALIKLTLQNLKIGFKIVREIAALGFSNFIMAITNGSVQIICSAALQKYGGDLYVGVMTVINSIREIVTMPVQGLTGGAQPVLSFNCGAKKYGRVKSGIKFSTGFSIVFAFAIWALLFFFP